MLSGGKLSPGFAVRLNLVVDPAILLFALHRATATGGLPHAAWIAFAVGVWLVVGIALPHYHPRAYERAAFDDAALLTILVMGVSPLLQTAHLVAPASVIVPRVARFFLLACPLLVAPRLFVFRQLARREAPPGQGLIL